MVEICKCKVPGACFSCACRRFGWGCLGPRGAYWRRRRRGRLVRRGRFRRSSDRRRRRHVCRCDLSLRWRRRTRCRLGRRRRSGSGSRFGGRVGRGAGRSRLRDLRGLTWIDRRVYPRTVRLRDGCPCRQAANESESAELERYIPHECWCRVACGRQLCGKARRTELSSLSLLLKGRQSVAAQCLHVTSKVGKKRKL